MELKNRTAIVTGAGQGIGRAVAETFGREGANVVVAEIDVQTGTEVASYLRAQGVRAMFVQTDVADEESVCRMVDRAAREFGSVYALCNNAAIEIAKDLRETESHEWDRILAVNLRSVYLCARAMLPHFIEFGAGAVVNISSVQALASTGRAAAYAASKGAILSMTRDLAQDFGRFNVRVNAICPGCIDTPMQDRALERVPDVKGALRLLTQSIPLKRTGRPQEVAEAALFLSSERSSYINGIALIVDGGLLAQLPIPRQ